MSKKKMTKEQTKMREALLREAERIGWDTIDGLKLRKQAKTIGVPKITMKTNIDSSPVKTREIRKPDRRHGGSRRQDDKTKAKLRVQNMRKYEVTILREIEYRAVIEVEAESEDVAKQMAQNIADNGNPYSNRWQEDHVLSQTFKVKVI